MFSISSSSWRCVRLAVPCEREKSEREKQPGFAVQQQHLEGHVLKEVRSAVVLLGLVAAAGVNPNTNGGGVAVAPLRDDTAS